jgi:hypothetical protein
MIDGDHGVDVILRRVVDVDPVKAVGPLRQGNDEFCRIRVPPRVAAFCGTPDGSKRGQDIVGLRAPSVNDGRAKALCELVHVMSHESLV